MRFHFGVALGCAALLITPAVASAGTTTAGHVRIAIDTSAAQADFTQTAGRTRYVVLQKDQRQRLQQLKAADPTTKVLLYQDLSGMVARDSAGRGASGVGTQEADANPDWYLRNTAGQRFTFSGYNWIHAADIGLRSYQDRWAQNVIAQLHDEGWDGVFVDDANPTIRYHYEPSAVAKYPNDAQYGAAMRSALARIGPAVRASGKLAIPNMGAWRDYPGVVDDWLQFVDGGMDEHFTKWSRTAGEGYIDGQQWENQLAAVKSAERQGKVYLGVTQSANSDDAAARYGWATMLLGAAGRSYYSLHGDYTNENWFPDYDLAIGEPSGVEAAGSDGVHRREFTNGLVLVNPTTVARTVSLGGRYSSTVHHDVSSLVLGPHTGVVLVKGAAPAAPPVALPPASEPAPQPPAAPTQVVAPAVVTPSAASHHRSAASKAKPKRKARARVSAKGRRHARRVRAARRARREALARHQRARTRIRAASSR